MTCDCENKCCDCDFDDEDQHAPEYVYRWKAVATVGISIMGAAVEYISGGVTGIGWAIVGILIVWQN